MKVAEARNVSSASPAATARRASGPEFSLSDAEDAAATQSPARSLGVSAVSTLDALIALQEVDEPLGRRRRAVKRASRLLDELDRLKLGLLADELSEADLHSLAEAVKEQREATSDPALEAVLDQIEARAAVELAKLEARITVP